MKPLHAFQPLRLPSMPVRIAVKLHDPWCLIAIRKRVKKAFDKAHNTMCDNALPYMGKGNDPRILGWADCPVFKGQYSEIDPASINHTVSIYEARGPRTGPCSAEEAAFAARWIGDHAYMNEESFNQMDHVIDRVEAVRRLDALHT